MGSLIIDERWEEAKTSDSEFAELSRELEDWLVGKPDDLETGRWLDGGSGSYVVVVRKTPAGESLGFEDLIMKLIPPGIGEAETDRTRAASKSEPAPFRGAHLVKVVREDRLPGRNWWIHLQKVAMGNLDEMPTLADLLDKPGLRGYCSTIVTSLMNDWNPGGISGSPEDPKNFFEDFLEERLRRDHVRTFAKREGISLDGSRPVSFPGRKAPLSNPFAVVTGLNGERRTAEKIFRGNSHGDLHVRNVLIPRTKSNQQATASKYQLIDLGRFDNKGPLSHDPMKLLLAIAAEWLPSLVPHTAIRSSLAELVVSPARYPASAPVAGYLDVARGIHAAAEKWAEARGAGGAKWRRQNLLVLIGCALRYFSREELNDADRWWYLEVAALAAREFVQDNDPKGDHFITAPTESCVTGRAKLRMASPAADRQVRDAVDNVIDFPGVRATRDPAPLLTEFANQIHRLPSGASEVRLAVIVIKLKERASELADALEGAEQIVLIENELRDIRSLLEDSGNCSCKNETVHELRAAGERLRSYGRKRWPGKVV